MQAGFTYHTLKYGTTTIEYELSFAARKTLAINVHPDLRVTVEAPEGSDLDQVEQKVKDRAAWIVRQQRDFKRYNFDVPPREYVSGESHRYLGRQYRLKVMQSATSREVVKMQRGRIFIYTPDTGARERVKSLLESWYRKRAKQVFRERLDVCYPHVERFGIEHPDLVVRRMKTRWGSCTEAGKITLNLKLVQKPKACIDYVIVHELCHLIEHNHSPAFYALMDRVMPDWQERRHRLNLLN
jgi:predicted metal-dependent hydrolase